MGSADRRGSIRGVVAAAAGVLVPLVDGSAPDIDEEPESLDLLLAVAFLQQFFETAEILSIGAALAHHATFEVAVAVVEGALEVGIVCAALSKALEFLVAASVHEEGVGAEISGREDGCATRGGSHVAKIIGDEAIATR
jgi:hypothetical protein